MQRLIDPSGEQPPVEVETGTPPAATVIWLHGLGADGHDFEPVVPALQLPASLPVRFVFPHAPYRPVTVNAGHVMRAWYDIVGLDPAAPEDAAGIADARRRVEALLVREIGRGIPAARIVLAGFSQGGAIALHAGLRHAQSLAGILALSTYLPLADRLAAEANPANAATSIFMAHGEADIVVPIGMARSALERLRDFGANVEFRSYAMGHAVIPEELVDIREWLVGVVQ